MTSDMMDAIIMSLQLLKKENEGVLVKDAAPAFALSARNVTLALHRMF